MIIAIISGAVILIAVIIRLLMKRIPERRILKEPEKPKVKKFRYRIPDVDALRKLMYYKGHTYSRWRRS